ncbi:hypothetical protein OPV22_010178 [Ensete ventricosum]|uniref:LOB domain-containing protein n=1 Tax=Ensete ventricosum TaxID=4639 RepID=A0AAV8RGV3_ENSVE|nr:hypothetical protein OPV22_010178 [Ensete ventricosum]
MAGCGSPCGACKFLRRKCVSGCVFAPHFCHEKGAAHFVAIHKVFGASNVSKLLMHLPPADRSEAVVTISYEAQARILDPVYGCVAHIFALQRQVVLLQAQLASLKAQARLALGNGTTSPGEGIAPPALASNLSTNHWLADSNSCRSSHDCNSHFAMVFRIQSEDAPRSMASLDVQAGPWRSSSSSSSYTDVEGLLSVAFAYPGTPPPVLVNPMRKQD